MSLRLLRPLRRCLPLAAIFFHGVLAAAQYSLGWNDPTNIWDAPVPGFTGPDGEGKARVTDGFGGFENERNSVNPIFFGWARGWSGYVRADGQTAFSDPSLALGPVTGDEFDVLSLGDLTAAQITAGMPVGKVTLHVTDTLHPAPIRNLPGADFVVFENGVVSESGTGGAGVGGVFGELAYVEVSSDGLSFARFPSISLTTGSVPSYGTLDPTKIFNLAGKHVNAGANCWGTPFDLAALANHPLVTAGTLDLNNVRYVRIVDIPGNGSFLDSAAPVPHPIYDPWHTFGSGGFDLEAIGVISAAMTFDAWQDFHGLTADVFSQAVGQALLHQGAGAGRVATGQDFAHQAVQVGFLQGRHRDAFDLPVGQGRREVDAVHQRGRSDPGLGHVRETGGRAAMVDGLAHALQPGI